MKAAEAKGQEIREDASYESQQILQDAQRKAYRIVNEAESSAMGRREGADHYARKVLFNLEEQLAEVLGQVRKGIDALKLDVEATQKHQKITNGRHREMRVWSGGRDMTRVASAIRGALFDAALM